MTEPNEKGRKRADASLLAAMALTCALAFAVIRGVSMEAPRGKPNPKVNVEKVKALMEKGRISDREADYWEVVP